MKKYVCFLFMAFGIAVASAQEVVVLRNTEEIEQSVIESAGIEKTRGKYIHRIKPQGNVYAGMVFNGWDWNIGPALDLAYGARFYDYFFLGLDLGYSCWFEKVYNGPYYEGYRTALHFASLRLNMKGYWPVSENLSPFLNLDLGTSVWVAGFAFFNMQVGAGVEFRRFSLGMGYNLLSLFGEDVHSGYLRLGVRF